MRVNRNKSPQFVSQLLLNLLIITSFLLNLVIPSLSFAQEIDLNLPAPSKIKPISKAFNPVLIRAITINPKDPFLFDFVIDKGDTALSQEDFEAETQKLARYFLAALTIPENDLWVNLSPYEEEAMVSPILGETEMGKDLLIKDYYLKQVTAQLTNPNTKTGKKFWELAYQKAQELYGTSKVPINTFSKVWIVPDKAVVLEKDGSAFIADNHLKVFLDQDYLAIRNNLDNEVIGTDKIGSKKARDINNFSSQIIKDVVLPVIENEVNVGENFATVRQIYSAAILATWYKQRLKESLLGKIYADKNKVAGVESDDPQAGERIFEKYTAALKTGAYNIIRQDYDLSTQKIVQRKYFSGGLRVDYGKVLESKPLTSVSLANLSPAASEAVRAASAAVSRTSLPGSPASSSSLVVASFSLRPAAQGATSRKNVTPNIAETVKALGEPLSLSVNPAANVNVVETRIAIDAALAMSSQQLEQALGALGVGNSDMTSIRQEHGKALSARAVNPSVITPTPVLESIAVKSPSAFFQPVAADDVKINAPLVASVRKLATADPATLRRNLETSGLTRPDVTAVTVASTAARIIAASNPESPQALMRAINSSPQLRTFAERLGNPERGNFNSQLFNAIQVNTPENRETRASSAAFTPLVVTGDIVGIVPVSATAYLMSHSTAQLQTVLGESDDATVKAIANNPRVITAMKTMVQNDPALFSQLLSQDGGDASQFNRMIGSTLKLADPQITDQDLGPVNRKFVDHLANVQRQSLAEQGRFSGVADSVPAQEQVTARYSLAVVIDNLTGQKGAESLYDRMNQSLEQNRTYNVTPITTGLSEQQRLTLQRFIGEHRSTASSAVNYANIAAEVREPINFQTNSGSIIRMTNAIPLNIRPSVQASLPADYQRQVKEIAVVDEDNIAMFHEGTGKLVVSRKDLNGIQNGQIQAGQLVVLAVSNSDIAQWRSSQPVSSRMAMTGLTASPEILARTMNVPVNQIQPFIDQVRQLPEVSFSETLRMATPELRNGLEKSVPALIERGKAETLVLALEKTVTPVERASLDRGKLLSEAARIVQNPQILSDPQILSRADQAPTFAQYVSRPELSRNIAQFANISVAAPAAKQVAMRQVIFNSAADAQTLAELLSQRGIGSQEQSLQIATAIRTVKAQYDSAPPEVKEHIAGMSIEEFQDYMIENTDIPQQAARQYTRNIENKVGGIDLSADKMGLEIKRDGAGVPLPISDQDIENLQIDGLVPLLLDVQPATPANVPFLLNLANNSSPGK